MTGLLGSWTTSAPESLVLQEPSSPAIRAPRPPAAPRTMGQAGEGAPVWRRAPVQVVARCAAVHHLHRAAGQAEGHGPQGAHARPVDHGVHLGHHIVQGLGGGGGHGLGGGVGGSHLAGQAAPGAACWRGRVATRTAARPVVPDLQSAREQRPGSGRARGGARPQRSTGRTAWLQTAAGPSGPCSDPRPHAPACAAPPPRPPCPCWDPACTTRAAMCSHARPGRCSSGPSLADPNHAHLVPPSAADAGSWRAGTAACLGAHGCSWMASGPRALRSREARRQAQQPKPCRTQANNGGPAFALHATMGRPLPGSRAGPRGTSPDGRPRVVQRSFSCRPQRCSVVSPRDRGC
jgi:hypothetical protein